MLNFVGFCYVSKFNGLLLWKLAKKDNWKVSLHKHPGSIIARACTILFEVTVLFDK